MTKHRVWLTICFLALVASPALAGGDGEPWTPAQEYLVIRDRVQALPFSGGPLMVDKTYEFRARLSGVSQGGDSPQTLHLTGEFGTISLPMAVQMEGLHSGPQVRVLAYLPASDEFEMAFRVLAIGLESHIAAIEPPPPSEDEEDSAGWRGERLRRSEIEPTSRSSRNRISRELSERIAQLVPSYRDAVLYFNSSLSKEDAGRIAKAVLESSVYWGVDPRLSMAMIAAESAFRPGATSPKGAMGLTQLMPFNAEAMGLSDPYDVEGNVAVGIRIIRGHLERNADDNPWRQLSLALASYNAGSGAVRKYQGVPPYRETQQYIKKVASIYLQLAGKGTQEKSDS